MSEFINNREYRQKELKRLIMKLHDGSSVEDVREEFAKLSSGVSANEIAAMEQSLVNEGMPVSDIQRLCDVHAAVFKGSIEEIHGYEAPKAQTDAQQEETDADGYPLNHPVAVFKSENRLVEFIISDRVLLDLADYVNEKTDAAKAELSNSLAALSSIDRHYARKEYLVFPLMEKNGITAPPQVMWGVDDEIRGRLKQVRALLADAAADTALLEEKTLEVTTQINEMIFKEEHIMLPMIADIFTAGDWENISRASAEIGYMLPGSVQEWHTPSPAAKDFAARILSIGEKVSVETAGGMVNEAIQNNEAAIPAGSREVLFDAGSLLPEEINAILNTVPLDMTFVDADDKVKYFTQGKGRIFDRPKTVIGREVKNCHPPKSVHIVEQIVSELRAGVKDHEDFWIRMGDKFVYIRYFAVRSADGKFLGTLEVTQNIKPIMELEGEKRLMQ
ncbi:MAG: DUF438 domain-containing protein [Saccharofermentanales bacterium]